MMPDEIELLVPQQVIWTLPAHCYFPKTHGDLSKTPSPDPVSRQAAVSASVPPTPLPFRGASLDTNDEGG